MHRNLPEELPGGLESMHTRIGHNAGRDSQLHLLHAFNTAANVKIQ